MSAQMELMTQEQLRDQALDLLAETRARLVGAARILATAIAQERGRVTSPEVLKAMQAGYGPELAQVDPRFMGVVFRNTKGSARRWRRVGWESKGSHARPVAVWELV